MDECLKKVEEGFARIEALLRGNGKDNREQEDIRK